MYDFAIIYERVFDYSGENITIGGIQTYLIELAKLISDEGYSVAIVQRSSVTFKLCHEGVSFIGCNHIEGKLPSYKYIARQAKELLKDNGVIIWGNDQKSIKVEGIKTVSIQHGITFDIEGYESKLKGFIARTPFNPIYRFIQRFNGRKSFEVSDFKVCVDYNFLNWYRTYISSKHLKNIVVIPNFTHLCQVSDLKKSERISVVFARRFVERRGCIIFAEAVKILYSQGYDFDVYFAGEGPLEQELRGLFYNEPRVVFTRFKAKDSQQFHSNKTISVVSSIGSEGTSLSLLEAMACKCAVVCTNVGGLTNIILDEHNGLICDPTSDSLALSLKRLLSDEALRSRVSENAYESIEDSFSLSKWKASWSDFLLQVRGN
ncbi:glycosyltransferase family 4 protein [Vibrio coralliirubri]|uniref:glycosyltransferase family 4 protein n=1 Tax=Vibrio coralliirubri TaxID=1516159 RepID=UPI002FE4225F